MKSTTNISVPNKMATKPVGKLLFTMSLPIMLSYIIEALYNIVDSLFVARFSEKALTAVSLAFPMQLLVISVTVGTSVGINVCLSRSLGAKDQNRVNRIAGSGIFLAFLTYIVFLLFGLFLAKVYFAQQTQDSEIFHLGVDYLSICMVLSFGGIGQITFQRFLQSTGKSSISMISQLIGAVFNTIFDPILIFGLFGFPRMGVKGAAIATISGQTLALCIAVFFNLSKNKEIKFSFRFFKPNKKIIGEIYHVGIPAIINQSLNSFMAFGVNFILIRISPTVVAAFGIYMRIQNFVFMPVFGVNNGVIAIAAFNYGAKSKERIDSVIKAGILFAASIMLIGTALIELFVNQIFIAFDASSELMSIGVRAMRIISLSYIFMAFILITQGVCQALGKSIYSLFISILRIVIVLLPILYLFSRLFILSNIWWAFTIADVFSALVAAFLLRHIYSQKVVLMKIDNVDS
jgi:putative MATE family efflux protein